MGARALQLSLGAPPLVKVPKGVSDPVQLARIELEEKKIPLAVVRELPGGVQEIIEPF